MKGIERGGERAGEGEGNERRKNKKRFHSQETHRTERTVWKLRRGTRETTTFDQTREDSGVTGDFPVEAPLSAEYKREVHQLAQDEWDRLPADARKAFEALASRLADFQ
jgi:hypothetical protein